MSAVRGWCPSAHRPMMSGDGLLVRVRPRMARLEAAKVFVLCDLADRYGNGLIEMTSRGNVQLRGVAPDDHPALLGKLIEAGLVAAEARGEVPLTVSPYLARDAETEALVALLERQAGDLPELPDKMGIVVDTGAERHLSEVSGDFRFERSGDGLILRADGVALGRPVTLESAADALVEMADWFCRAGGGKARRMRHLAGTVAMPEGWAVAKPAGTAAPSAPDASKGILGVEFGQIAGDDLRKLVEASEATGLVVTPWRMVFLLGGRLSDLEKVIESAGKNHGFSALIVDSGDPRLRVDACPGAPLCAQASVSTRPLARRLAAGFGQAASARLHVSGCAKGCARRGAASVTLVGRDGTFDLVLDGRAGDTPVRRGLTEAQVVELFG